MVNLMKNKRLNGDNSQSPLRGNSCARGGMHAMNEFLRYNLERHLASTIDRCPMEISNKRIWQVDCTR
jgi:hypothetical protein